LATNPLRVGREMKRVARMWAIMGCWRGRSSGVFLCAAAFVIWSIQRPTQVTAIMGVRDAVIHPAQRLTPERRGECTWMSAPSPPGRGYLSHRRSAAQPWAILAPPRGMWSPHIRISRLNPLNPLKQRVAESIGGRSRPCAPLAHYWSRCAKDLQANGQVRAAGWVRGIGC
jgi:hypothetical protein